MPNPDAEHWKTKYDRLCEILNEQTPLYEALKAENERLRAAGDKLCSALGEGQANGDFDRRYAEAIVAWAKLTS